MRTNVQGRRVAIIGGGIAGAYLAHVLRLYGVTTDIYEQHEGLGTQSARRSAGQLSPDHGGPLSEASRAIMTSWEQECGFPRFLTPCPTAHLALRDAPDESYAHILRNGSRPSLVEISPSEAAELWGPGLIRPERISRAAVDLADYRLNPRAIVEAVQNSASHESGQVVTQVQVGYIDKGVDGGWIVGAEHLGTPEQQDEWIRSPVLGTSYTHVVNAAGAYANEVAILAGQTAPSVKPTMGTSFRARFPRQISPRGPMLVWDTETLLGCYLMPSGKDHVFGSPADERHCWPQIPRPDLGVMNNHLAGIEDLFIDVSSERLRELSAVGCMRTYGYGPDDRPIIGVTNNGWVDLSGLGSHGVQWGPALAEFLASKICEVRPPNEIEKALEPHQRWLASCSPRAQRLPTPKETHPYGKFRYPYVERAGVEPGSAEWYLPAPVVRVGDGPFTTLDVENNLRYRDGGWHAASEIRYDARPGAVPPYTPRRSVTLRRAGRPPEVPAATTPPERKAPTV